MIDILSKIINSKLSVQEAEKIFDEIMDMYHEDKLDSLPQDEMCLNEYEWTAIGFGVSLEVLAKWRGTGWPKKCADCNKVLDYKSYGWRIKDDKLVCIQCDPKETNMGM